MRSSAEFRRVVRHGARAGRPTLVVHAADQLPAGDVRVGFVVSKAVGNAVVRNRVKRKLRHLARGQLASTPSGVGVIVRALPSAVTNSSRLEDDLRQAWAKAIGRVQQRADHSDRQVRP
jgi:ribonuclease P protein component